MLGGTADLRDWRHQDWLIVSAPVFIFTPHFVPRSESFAFRMRRPKGDNQLLSTIYKKFPENTVGN